MPTSITMPQFAETLSEGTLVRWLKAAGDAVQQDEPLAEIDTDKVAVTMVAPYTGRLTELVVQEGTTVPVGQVIAYVEAGAVDTASAPQPASPRPAPPDQEPAPASNSHGATAMPVHSNGHASAPVPASNGHAAPSQPLPVVSRQADLAPLRARPESYGGHFGTLSPIGVGRVTPVVARLASEYQVDLRQIQGTGEGGRISRQDVLAYLQQRDGGQPATPSSAPTASDRADAPPAGAAALRPAPPSPDEKSIPVSAVRRTIAQRMVESKQNSPHAWCMVEVDVTELVRWRQAAKAEFAGREGVDLTYLAPVARVVTRTLQEFPLLNSSWAGDRIVLHPHVNLGLAAAREEGLIVPVVRNADGLSFGDLARAIHRLVEAARTNTLSPEDVIGGTFTLNNTGALGIVLSYPILVPGQTGILTMEAIVKRPVVLEDDQIVVRHMMNMALAFDHRVMDGLTAGRFMQALKGRLEQWNPASVTGAVEATA